MTRAKYCISRLRPFQGMVPWKPMPMLRVAATMRVSSGVAMAVMLVIRVMCVDVVE